MSKLSRVMPALFTNAAIGLAGRDVALTHQCPSSVTLSTRPVPLSPKYSAMAARHYHLLQSQLQNTLVQ